MRAFQVPEGVLTIVAMLFSEVAISTTVLKLYLGNI
tara:strand:- start:58158 stop:58265 length:108 start_codon:yes stop_codon:yes gene_type:complete